MFPLIAQSYALQFAQNELVAKCHELQTSDDPDAEEQRELESRAAGLKAANTWHATRAIQEAREACGGAGYLAENRLIALKADTDVFTTFEGDNHVLTQLVAKELLTAYADDIKGMSPVEWVRFAANFAGERVLKRTAAQTIMQTILDTRQDNEEEGSLFNRGTQVKMFEDREEYMIASVARRLQGKSKEMSPFDAFNSVQDHVLHAARAHIERIILEAFVAGIDSCEDDEAREILDMVCDLYALSVIEKDRAWFMEHRFLSTERAKAVTRGINERCRNLRPYAELLVDGFGDPRAVALRRDAAPGEHRRQLRVVGGRCQTRHMTDRDEFAGRSALITGGTRGIGKGIADRLRAGGARVLVAARSVPDGLSPDDVVVADVSTARASPHWPPRRSTGSGRSISRCTTSADPGSTTAGRRRSRTRTGSPHWTRICWQRFGWTARSSRDGWTWFGGDRAHHVDSAARTATDVDSVCGGKGGTRQLQQGACRTSWRRRAFA